MEMTVRYHAAGVWEKVDEGELTKAQALRICGPRPKES